jgi:hypothetical protein
VTGFQEGSLERQAFPRESSCKEADALLRQEGHKLPHGLLVSPVAGRDRPQTILRKFSILRVGEIYEDFTSFHLTLKGIPLYIQVFILTRRGV